MKVERIVDSHSGTRRMLQAVTPPLATLSHAAGMSPALDRSASYLSMLTGKGGGSGWDRGETLAAARILRKLDDPTVVDCGANQGTWTEGVRSALGHCRGRWLLVEPMAEYAARLRQLANVSVAETAIGEAAATMQLYVPDRPSGWMSLHPRSDSFVGDVHFTSRPVPVVRLDDLLHARGIDRVDFLKMDLEGHELFALRGAARYLQHQRITALSFEFGSANVNSRTFFRDIWDFLDQRGYRLSRILPGGRLLAVDRYEETLEFFRGATNYVASI
jgi:FkbM family methyltransferase